MSQSKIIPGGWTVAAALAVALAGATGLSAGESRWYVQGAFGQSNLEASFGSRHTKSFDGEDAAAGFEVGYALHKNLAVQAGFHDLGEFDGFGSPCRESDEICIALDREALAQAAPPTALCAIDFPCVAVVLPLQAAVTGWTVSLVPRLPLGERWSLFGKVGMADWESEISPRSSAFVATRETFSERDLLAGVGAQYAFPSGVGLLVQYQELDFGLGSTSFGASWRF